MDALELLKQDHKTVKELLRTAKETEDSKKQRQPFGKSGPSWKPMRRRSTRSLKDGRSVNVSALALRAEVEQFYEGHRIEVSAYVDGETWFSSSYIHCAVLGFVLDFRRATFKLGPLFPV